MDWCLCDQVLACLCPVRVRVRACHSPRHPKRLPHPRLRLSCQLFTFSTS